MAATKLRSGSTVLELGPINNEYIKVKIKTENLSAEISSFIYTDTDIYYSYFNDLVENWKGWKGFKCWNTVESDLKFEASFMPNGCISFRVSLISDQGGEDDWKLVAKLTLEPSQLQQVVKDIRSQIDNL